MTNRKPATDNPAKRVSDSFEAVAKRLECDPDMDRFKEKLGKIAKAKPKGKAAGSD